MKEKLKPFVDMLITIGTIIMSIVLLYGLMVLFANIN
jgi:hypothetical protein